jgi:hypothetical protein
VEFPVAGDEQERIGIAADEFRFVSFDRTQDMLEIGVDQRIGRQVQVAAHRILQLLQWVLPGILAELDVLVAQTEAHPVPAPEVGGQIHGIGFFAAKIKQRLAGRAAGAAGDHMLLCHGQGSEPFAALRLDRRLGQDRQPYQVAPGSHILRFQPQFRE